MADCLGSGCSQMDAEGTSQPSSMCLSQPSSNLADVFLWQQQELKKNKCKTPMSSLCLHCISSPPPHSPGPKQITCSNPGFVRASLFYCCVTNCYKLSNEKQHTFLNLTISIGQKLEHTLTGSSHRLESKYGQGA